MEVCFDGTDYHGWQLQPNGITVQEVLEDRLGKLFGGRKIRIQGSSRTDSGVHALGMVASFRSPESPFIPDWKVKKALNRLLPHTIKVTDVSVNLPTFNARFSAFGKAYVYCINTGDLNPYHCRWSWHLPKCTRVDAMREAVKHFVGTHDFSAFTVNSGQVDDPVRSIIRAEIKQFGPLLCICFVGDGFLYKMVRCMVGTLADVGRGRITADTVKQMLDGTSPIHCDTAPAVGLFLMKVFYENNGWDGFDFDKPPFWLL